MYFNNDQTSQVNDLIRKIEEHTGIELVAAVVGKCDNYPEVPWKAFALAAAAATLAIMVLPLAAVRTGCPVLDTMRYAPLFIIGAGAAAALLSVFWPALGRLFLDRARIETETDQYARALFLERELFRTRGRNGILLLVSLFERSVVIVPDKGVIGRIDNTALHTVIKAMTPLLRRKDRFQALVHGLSALEAELLQAGFKPAPKTDNEISDGLIQRKGDD